MAREDPQLKLRLTDEMKAKITDAARAAGRSVNAEIVARLEASLDGPREANTVYVLLDADGHPTSWPEVSTHLNALAEAAGFAPESIEARVFNSELVSSSNREGEWLALQEHYRKLRKTSKAKR